jgi:branched-chain amino acid transport system substrate-binding protein
MNKRAFTLFALTSVLIAFLAASASAADVVKVGFLGPLTGIFSASGKDMLEGLKMALEETGYQAGGTKIVVIDEDTEGNPATAQAKYRKLVAQDRIDVLAGILLVNVGYALVPNIERDRLPAIFLTTPDDLTKRRPTKYITRVSFSASQPMHALGDYAAKTLRYKRVVAIGMDNGFGHEGIGGFQRVFEDAGGRITQKIWVPLSSMDFAPYLTQIPRDVDACLVVVVAGQAIRFAKQFGETSLSGRMPLIGTGVFSDESILRSMGDEVIGFIGPRVWTPTLDNPINGIFMRLAEPKLRRTPSQFHLGMYSAGRWILAAVKSLHGNVDNRDAFVTAIRKASETTPDPRGPIKLDAYANPTQNIYIVKVERVNGSLQNTVVHTYPMVSQFWTYLPEEFLRSPAYDRNYPPLKP